jgi:hypothetical protein
LKYLGSSGKQGCQRIACFPLLGTAVFAGMLGVTLFAVFLTPVFYILGWFGGGKPSSPSAPQSTPEGARAALMVRSAEGLHGGHAT